jgi:hypothetical protein
MGDKPYTNDVSSFTGSDGSKSDGIPKVNKSKGRKLSSRLKGSAIRLSKSLNLPFQFKEDHSIPNAFMVSTRPGHPFWIQGMEYVKVHQNDKKVNKQPEYLTGPVALKQCVDSWEDRENEQAREKLGILDEVVVLQNGEVSITHPSSPCFLIFDSFADIPI